MKPQRTITATVLVFVVLMTCVIDAARRRRRDCCNSGRICRIGKYCVRIGRKCRCAGRWVFARGGRAHAATLYNPLAPFDDQSFVQD